ncbi:MAG: hypothetical protein KIT76_01720 [Pseudolabrys sp.]|jgi:hypothetical protein|nr:hypothetical protein [Pseudorhodoplanes sp.]MCW5687241.1 hypothetical protein [Pseudolabrys sp.]HWV43975.1 hypothetical protein [Pseudorhodoplanes sp.]
MHTIWHVVARSYSNGCVTRSFIVGLILKHFLIDALLVTVAMNANRD